MRFCDDKHTSGTLQDPKGAPRGTPGASWGQIKTWQNQNFSTIKVVEYVSKRGKHLIIKL